VLLALCIAADAAGVAIEAAAVIARLARSTKTRSLVSSAEAPQPSGVDA